MHSFLEGPSFDRSGNLYVVDLAHGRIFRISPAAEWDLFAEYDGQPNGLKIHRDGSIFVADAMHGILRFDPRTGRYETVAAMFDGAKFIGPNDLVFADNGDLWFTDPGHSGQHDPCGRVFRLATDGRLDLMIDGLAYPNGLVLTPKQDALLVGVTSSLQVIRMSLTAPRPGRWRTFVQLSGGHAGPDGLAVDEEGNFVVVHAGFGTVWQFSPLGEPLARIRSCAGIRTTNIAYGGADMRTLYITECEDGVVLTARLSTPGRRMFSHM
jgi:gluconolactonase